MATLMRLCGVAAFWSALPNAVVATTPESAPESDHGDAASDVEKEITEETKRMAKHLRMPGLVQNISIEGSENEDLGTGVFAARDFSHGDKIFCVPDKYWFRPLKKEVDGFTDIPRQMRHAKKQGLFFSKGKDSTSKAVSRANSTMSEVGPSTDSAAKEQQKVLFYHNPGLVSIIRVLLRIKDDYKEASEAGDSAESDLAHAYLESLPTLADAREHLPLLWTNLNGTMQEVIGGRWTTLSMAIGRKRAILEDLETFREHVKMVHAESAEANLAKQNDPENKFNVPKFAFWEEQRAIFGEFLPDLEDLDKIRSDEWLHAAALVLSRGLSVGDVIAEAVAEAGDMESADAVDSQSDTNRFSIDSMQLIPLINLVNHGDTRMLFPTKNSTGTGAENDSSKSAGTVAGEESTDHFNAKIKIENVKKGNKNTLQLCLYASDDFIELGDEILFHYGAKSNDLSWIQWGMVSASRYPSTRIAFAVDLPHHLTPGNKETQNETQEIKNEALNYLRDNAKEMSKAGNVGSKIFSSSNGAIGELSKKYLNPARGLALAFEGTEVKHFFSWLRYIVVHRELIMGSLENEMEIDPLKTFPAKQIATAICPTFADFRCDRAISAEVEIAMFQLLLDMVLRRARKLETINLDGIVGIDTDALRNQTGSPVDPKESFVVSADKQCTEAQASEGKCAIDTVAESSSETWESKDPVLDISGDMRICLHHLHAMHVIRMGELNVLKGYIRIIGVMLHLLSVSTPTELYEELEKRYKRKSSAIENYMRTNITILVEQSYEDEHGFYSYVDDLYKSIQSSLKSQDKQIENAVFVKKALRRVIQLGHSFDYGSSDAGSIASMRRKILGALNTVPNNDELDSDFDAVYRKLQLLVANSITSMDQMKNARGERGTSGEPKAGGSKPPHADNKHSSNLSKREQRKLARSVLTQVVMDVLAWIAAKQGVISSPDDEETERIIEKIATFIRIVFLIAIVVSVPMMSRQISEGASRWWFGTGVPKSDIKQLLQRDKRMRRIVGHNGGGS